MKKIEETNKKLFGDYAVAISGFDHNEQKKLLNLIETSFEKLKAIFVNDSLHDKILKEIFSKEHKHGYLSKLYSKKAIIMSGFLEKDIVQFMKTVRELGTYPQLWAVLTPTSNNWKFNDLIAELEQEAQEIKKMQQSKKTQ